MTLDSDSIAWIGLWLLAIGVAAIVVEATLAAFWSVRVTRRAQVLRERLAGEQEQLKAEVERLQAALAETTVLWQPYGRLLRWLQHPLAIAVLQSLARRRAAVR